jgi:chromosome partitioning protein
VTNRPPGGIGVDHGLPQVPEPAEPPEGAEQASNGTDDPQGASNATPSDDSNGSGDDLPSHIEPDDQSTRNEGDTSGDAAGAEPAPDPVQGAANEAVSSEKPDAAVSPEEPDPAVSTEEPDPALSGHDPDPALSGHDPDEPGAGEARAESVAVASTVAAPVPTNEDDAESPTAEPSPSADDNPAVAPSTDALTQLPTQTASSARADRALPRAIAIANQKGGVGKTTTAVNLGAGLAEIGYRVLVVDLDPQGNATTGLGINPRSLESSVYDVLMNDAPLEDSIEPTAVRNLFVVPATIDLAGAEIELVPTFSRELKLRRAIDSQAGEFDFTLIDCPPSLGLLTVNGLAAAGEVLVPIQCEYYALEGLGQLLKNIQLVQSNLNPRLELSTIVLTMYDARTRLADQVSREVREHFGGKVCRTIVPRTVRLSEAPSFGQPINVFDPSSRGATAYRELAKEVSGGAARRAG